MSSNEREFASLTAIDSAEHLLGFQKLLVIFHVHPDGDAIGSAFALKEFWSILGREAHCLCADAVPDRLRFISGEADCSKLPEGFLPDGIVTVDTASPSQMGALYDIYKNKVDLMIDHHGKGSPYADNCIAPSAAACGELVYEIIKAMAQKEKISELSLRVYELIYAAVSADTGCFRYSNVTKETHITAGELISMGVDSADINHRLFGIKSLKQMQVEHAGFERMNFHLDGKVAIITFPYDLKSQYGAEDEDLETLIDVARCVKGVMVAAVIKQPTQENKFRVSMRSSCDFDVSEVCAMYGGGGHTRAAGCTVVSDSILSAEMTIVVAVEHKMSEG